MFSKSSLLDNDFFSDARDPKNHNENYSLFALLYILLLPNSTKYSRLQKNKQTIDVKKKFARTNTHTHTNTQTHAYIYRFGIVGVQSRRCCVCFCGRRRRERFVVVVVFSWTSSHRERSDLVVVVAVVVDVKRSSSAQPRESSSSSVMTLSVKLSNLTLNRRLIRHWRRSVTPTIVSGGAVVVVVEEEKVPVRTGTTGTVSTCNGTVPIRNEV